MQVTPITRVALILMALVSVSAFSKQQNTAASSQPSEERKAQDALPQANDPMWSSLTASKIHYDDKKHTYSITYTPEVKAMEGKQEAITGFILLLEPTEKFTHFILSKRTPTCPFCPPGEPNEIVEVFTKKPIAYSEGMLVVTGTMRFTNNPDLGMFYQLKDADTMDMKPVKMPHKTPII